jgi:hypothetical protein
MYEKFQHHHQQAHQTAWASLWVYTLLLVDDIDKVMTMQ